MNQSTASIDHTPESLEQALTHLQINVRKGIAIAVRGLDVDSAEEGEDLHLIDTKTTNEFLNLSMANITEEHHASLEFSLAAARNVVSRITSEDELRHANRLLYSSDMKFDIEMVLSQSVHRDAFNILVGQSLLYNANAPEFNQLIQAYKSEADPEQLYTLTDSDIGALWARATRSKDLPDRERWIEFLWSKAL